MTTRQVLEDAVQLLREKGRTQGDFEDDDGHICVVEALAETIDPDTIPVGTRFADTEPCRLLREAIGSDNIAGWQDAPERTFAEVEQAFERAIEAAK